MARVKMFAELNPELLVLSPSEGIGQVKARPQMVMGAGDVYYMAAPRDDKTWNLWHMTPFERAHYKWQHGKDVEMGDIIDAPTLLQRITAKPPAATVENLQWYFLSTTGDDIVNYGLLCPINHTFVKGICYTASLDRRTLPLSKVYELRSGTAADGAHTHYFSVVSDGEIVLEPLTTGLLATLPSADLQRVARAEGATYVVQLYERVAADGSEGARSVSVAESVDADPEFVGRAIAWLYLNKSHAR